MNSASVWQNLDAHAQRLKPLHLRALLADAGRFETHSASFDDLLLDFSREKLDRAVVEDLIALAEASDLPARRAALFAGEPVNISENRPALHMALRGGASAPASDDVAGTLARFLDFAEKIRAGDWTDVINIGIGGSDLGPAMAARALAPDCDGPRLHFVGNGDGADFADTVRGLTPETTLVIVCSKTFTTAETMANARLARDWLGEHAAGNMAAASTNLHGCADFGIPGERVFGFWDWVGGRYSVWSAIGLALAIGIGAEKFRAFLDGAADMDRHFLKAPLPENLPVLMGLIGVWRRSFLNLPAVALIPYDQRLARFPAHIQQLAMESNGKRVRADGQAVSGPTCPLIFGEPGTNAQHSFFQLLHQGTDVIPVEFILASQPRDADADSHRMLAANAVAQADALARGRTTDEALAALQDGKTTSLAAQKTFPGDRPSSILLHRSLTPYTLGRLIALYEHRIFVEATVWGINPFDQWGVELGKEMATAVAASFSGDAPAAGIVAELRARWAKS